jgi:hypothetical protein
MEFISFRCTSCKQGLKVPVANAGRKVKCTKCGTALKVPAAPQAGASAAPSPFAKKPYEEEEDEGGIYGVEGMEEHQAEIARVEEERRRKERRKQEQAEEESELDEEEREEGFEELRRRLAGEDDEDDYEDEDEEEGRPKKKRPPRVKLDRPAFQKVRVGALLALIAVSFLALSVLLHKLVLLIGLFAGPHYTEVMDEILPAGSEESVDLMRFAIAHVGGIKSEGANKALLLISQLCILFQEIIMIAACVFCLSAPPRFGTKGLALTALIVAGVNLVVGVVFRFLPVVGAMKFVLLPLFGGELAMSEANFGRQSSGPIHLLWCGIPYLQVLLTMFVLVLNFGELIIFPLFLRAVAKQLKAEQLERSSLSLVQLGLAQVFAQVAYQVMAMTGSSWVLGIVLKVFYILGLCFFVWQLTWYILILIYSRTVIQEALDSE